MKLILICWLAGLFVCGSCHDREPLDCEHWIEKYDLTSQGRRQEYTSSMNLVGNPETNFTADWFYGLIKGSARTYFYKISKATSILNLIRGAPIDVYTLDPINGDLTKQTLGGRFSGGLVRMIPAGHYLGIQLRSAIDPTRYSLYNVVTLPMIEPGDIEQADRTDLLSRFPQHASIIQQFTS